MVVKKLVCHQINSDAPQIIPGRSGRSWMDATNQRYAYRCLPLTIANSMGWELLCPASVVAEWNGGSELEDITVQVEGVKKPDAIAQSHFGHGVLTFQTNYLFRTDPGCALWVRGSPNSPKDGIAPLDGIVETDWLEFTFTMNWMFTRPGRVTFEKDEPFCFITPIRYHALDRLVPEIVPIGADAELEAAYQAYGKLRLDFNTRLAADDPEIVKRGWQKWYLRGHRPSGEPGNPQHISKLHLAAPRLRQASAHKGLRRKKGAPRSKPRQGD